MILYFRSKQGVFLVTFLLCKTLLINNAITANELRQMRLSSAVYQALTKSIEIKRSESRLGIAESTQGEAIGNYLPSVSASWQIGNKKSRVEGIKKSESTDQNSKQLSLHQPIFNGFQSIHHSHSSNYLVLAAEAELYETKSMVTMSAIDSFLTLYTTRKSLELYKKNSKISQDIYDHVTQRLSLKVISKNDAANYEVDILRSETDLLEAKKRNNHAEAMFDTVIGGYANELEIPEIPHVTFNSQHSITDALANNPKLQRLSYLEKSAKANVAREKGGLLPKATLVGSLEKQEDVLYLDNKDVNTSQYHLDISIPIFQKGQRYVQIKKAIHEWELSQKEVALGKEDLLNTLKTTLQTYHSNKALHASYKQLETLALEKVNRYREQVDINATDTISFLVTQKELHTIQINALVVQKELLSDYYKIRLLLGDLAWIQ
jgi:outer membrane protein